MRNYLLILLMAGLVGLLPGPTTLAQDHEETDVQAVVSVIGKKVSKTKSIEKEDKQKHTVSLRR